MINQLFLGRRASRKQKNKNPSGTSSSKRTLPGLSRSPEKARVRRGAQGLAVAAASVALVASGCTGIASAAPGPSAHATTSLSVNDEGHFHLVSESGANLIEEGEMTGNLPGRARVSFNIGVNVTASFVLYPRNGGSLSGRGSGKLSSSGRWASFGGTMSVFSGTGRYSHAHGTGGLYGTILRRAPYSVVVQTRGTLDY
jgi:hypothetical protein